MENSIIILRFAVIFVLSLIFGIERHISKKPVGFGTFIFVSVGSCALGITALIIEPQNPLPLLGAIVTGIGFLGAGALIKTTDKVFGFTTAASIWIFAVIGLIIGVGEYLIGLVAYSIIWVIILTDRFMEIKGIGTYQRKIIISARRIIDKSEILPIFEKRKWRLDNLSIDKKNKKSSMTYFISIPREDINRIKNELIKKDWVDSFKIE